MKGIIVTNAYYSTPTSEHQAMRLFDELKKLGVEAEIVKNGEPNLIGEKFDCDFAVIFDKDINFVRNLELSGVRTFNSSESIGLADDKIKTALVLKENGFEIPDTIALPKLYYYDYPDTAYIRKAGKKLGYPLVIKEAFGSLGQQVYLAKTFYDAVRIVAQFGTKSCLFQKYETESKGQSIRAIVIGGKVLCAMRLTSEEDFRSNAENGGVAESIELPQEYIDIAERVALTFGLDYCGIDFFANKPIVIEVNSNAYFETMEKVSQVNVAEAYAKHILNKAGEKLCVNSLNS